MANNNNFWYALQINNNDDWGTGTFLKDEAIKMLLENDCYNLIAVIENDVCIKEIYKKDIL